ncbi:MAG: hypothetical protein H7A43_07065 [Verrucomicrobia bacterium]|nr:hypothetical protein [Kiritimatiellia bacterium]MCP5488394.1 hypothetical protein [Verrucomicrobiota bacterium]
MNLKDLGAIWSKGDKDKQAPIIAVLISVFAHILLIIGAGYLTVLVIQGREKVMFEAKKPPSITARKLEHSIRVKQMQQQVRKPQILQRLVSQAPSAVALPELPKMDTPDLKKMKDSPMMQRNAGLLGDLGRAGGGLGRGDTGGTGYSDTKFFGENVRTRAIGILVDVTSSMFNKGAIDDVMREASSMLQDLHPGTKFTLIAFVDGSEAMSDQMLYAVQENKDQAIAWLKTLKMNSQGNKRGYSGSTPDEAIRLATEQGVDTIFLLTDDVPYISIVHSKNNRETIESHPDDVMRFVKEIETNFGRSVKINPIIYKATGRKGEASKEYWKKVARATGGKLLVVD